MLVGSRGRRKSRSNAEGPKPMMWAGPYEWSRWRWWAHFNPAWNIDFQTPRLPCGAEVSRGSPYICGHCPRRRLRAATERQRRGVWRSARPWEVRRANVYTRRRQSSSKDRCDQGGTASSRDTAIVRTTRAGRLAVIAGRGRRMRAVPAVTAQVRAMTPTAARHRCARSCEASGDGELPPSVLSQSLALQCSIETSC